MNEDAPAADVYEVVTQSASLIRRAVTSVFALVSVVGGSASVPQWRRYEIRHRRSGETLRVVNDDVDGRDIEFSLHKDLRELTAEEFALRWKVRQS